jgi:hypothetical protein
VIANYATNPATITAIKDNVERKLAMRLAHLMPPPMDAPIDATKKLLSSSPRTMFWILLRGKRSSKHRQPALG